VAIPLIPRGNGLPPQKGSYRPDNQIWDQRNGRSGRGPLTPRGHNIPPRGLPHLANTNQCLHKGNDKIQKEGKRDHFITDNRTVKKREKKKNGHPRHILTGFIPACHRLKRRQPSPDRLQPAYHHLKGRRHSQRLSSPHRAQRFPKIEPQKSNLHLATSMTQRCSSRARKGPIPLYEVSVHTEPPISRLR